jgi:hypothetical protein
MTELEQIELHCITNGKTLDADILSCNDKHLKVAVAGTNVVIRMQRQDLRRPYVGHIGQLEFRTTKEPPRV